MRVEGWEWRGGWRALGEREVRQDLVCGVRRTQALVLAAAVGAQRGLRTRAPGYNAFKRGYGLSGVTAAVRPWQEAGGEEDAAAHACEWPAGRGEGRDGAHAGGGLDGVAVHVGEDRQDEYTRRAHSRLHTPRATDGGNRDDTARH